MYSIFSNKKIESPGIKKVTCEALISYIYRLPNSVSQQQLKNVLEMIFIQMIDIDEDITNEWNSPPEGFEDNIEDDDDFETTRFGQESIDRLVNTVGLKKIMPIMNEMINQMLVHSDWRYQFASLMALSQIGEYFDEISEIYPILQIVSRFIKSPNTKIRYAAYHVIAQVSEDLAPDF